MFLVEREIKKRKKEEEEGKEERTNPVLKMVLRLTFSSRNKNIVKLPVLLWGKRENDQFKLLLKYTIPFPEL